MANARTLEQKISDAGPYNQRIDPHVLTPVRNDMVENKVLAELTSCNAKWFYLANTSRKLVNERLDEQLVPYKPLSCGLNGRVGECLEIAIYRALLRQNNLDHIGSFLNLDDHDDSARYKKEEPPTSLNGLRLDGDKKLDFMVRHPKAGWAGIEAKNVREWFYPNRKEIKDLLAKCISLDCIPVLIGRRIHFVTFKLLSTCGVIFHQTYNQLLPDADAELAAQAKDKKLLGYHDIRTGNVPDARLEKFICKNLPIILPEARAKFEKFKDLLKAFVFYNMEYSEFAARVRRRTAGTNEDNDWPEEPDPDF